MSPSSAAATASVDPKTFNLEEGLPELLKVMAVLSIVAFLNYLQTHPLPAWDPERDIDRRQQNPPAA